jgi:hypothetical protein
MRKGLIILIAIVLLFIFCGYSLAQEQSEKSVVSSKSAHDHKGDKGLCFSVSGLSSVGIGQYEGGIGGKYWISNKMALVSSIGFNFQSKVQDNSSTGYTNSKRSSVKFSPFVGIEDHFFVNKLSPYIGVGIGFSTNSTIDNYRIPIINPPPGLTKKYKTIINSYKFRCSCGIEYFFAKWVSLTGQYQMDYYYETNTRQATLVAGPGVTQPKKEKINLTTFGMGTSVLVATFYIW